MRCERAATSALRSIASRAGGIASRLALIRRRFGNQVRGNQFGVATVLALRQRQIRVGRAQLGLRRRDCGARLQIAARIEEPGGRA